MSFFTELLKSVQRNQVFGQPQPTPTAGGNYQQVVPTDVFSAPPIQAERPVQDFWGTPSFNPQVSQPMLPQLRPNTVLDDYVQHARYPPNWERPSGWRMLGTALLSGLRRTPDKVTESYDKEGRVSRVVQKGGHTPLDYEEVDYFLNMPNRRRLDEWKLKGGSLKEAAAAEDRRLQQESLADSRYGNLAIRQGNLTVAQQREARLRDTAEGRAELDRLKYQLEKWKAQNPRGQIVFPRGGNVTVINPITGEATDTGIPTGLMNELERQTLIGQQRIDQINTQGLIRDSQIGMQHGNAVELEGIRQGNALDRIAATGDQARQTRQTPSANAGANSVLPTQERVRLQNRVGMLIAMNPDWEKWLTINPNSGQVEITRPATKWYERGPDQRTYDAMVAAVYGPNQQPQQATKPGPELNKPGRKWEQNPSTGQWRYSDDNGKTWTIVGGR